MTYWIFEIKTLLDSLKLAFRLFVKIQIDLLNNILENMKLLFFVLLISPIIWASDPISYKNYKVVEFNIETEDQLKTAQRMEMMTGVRKVILILL